ncbi:hypothetical protein EST38_g4875 [Candolleomyces aberdarensis]|uniref:Fungal-type protein kinase domain-containing protein n=1 Tax=Candolleomyces aberdarensis TaxID=2316362 RepID=A0A4Q2DLY4_9AGAR|nr:hypothetical protein EST38_g4875 [Candolleomyces aberdarensis]
MPINEFMKLCAPQRRRGRSPAVLDDKKYFSSVPTTASLDLRKQWDAALGEKCYVVKGKKVRVKGIERHMYNSLLKDFQLLLPNCTVVDTSNHHKSLKGRPTQLDKADLLMEVKTTKVKVFGDAPFLLTTQDATETLARISTCLMEYLNHQWRTFVFFILFTDPMVYIIRADRAGLIITEGINIRTHPRPFLEFLWRFKSLSREERGVDPTVQLATGEDVKLAKMKLAQYVPDNKKHHPVLVLDVPNESGLGKVRQVLVWGSHYDSVSLTGRCTRAFAAWDPMTEKVQFLKDVWRTDAGGLEKESDIIRTLNKANVSHVPTLVAGDDLPGKYQRTLTQEYGQSEWVKSNSHTKLDARVHHRLLVNFIPKFLADYESPIQFLQVIFDAFLAHKGAYELGYLHRDVSENNIMIDENGRGVLIDWELAIQVKDEHGNPLNHEARQSHRTGTWAFISCYLLKGWHRHELSDDLQSFLWVALYYIIRTFKFEVPMRPMGVEALLEQYFDYCIYDNVHDTFSGGAAKETLILGTSPLKSLHIPSNPPLEKWYKDTLQVFKDKAFQGILNHTEGQAGSPQPDHHSPLRLDNHSTLEKIFEDALASDGWSPTRDDVKTEPLSPEPPSGSHHHLGSTTTKRKAPLLSDDVALRRSHRIREAPQNDRGGAGLGRPKSGNEATHRPTRKRKAEASQNDQGGSRSRQPNSGRGSKRTKTAKAPQNDKGGSSSKQSKSRNDKGASGRRG